MVRDQRECGQEQSANLGKWMSNFRAQTAVHQRKGEGRGQDGRAGRKKFCWSHFCWAPERQGKLRRSE